MNEFYKKTGIGKAKGEQVSLEVLGTDEINTTLTAIPDGLGGVGWTTRTPFERMYDFDTATTNTNPGDGKYKFNGAKTFMNIAVIGKNGVDVSFVYEFMNTGDTLIPIHIQNHENFIRVKLTGAPVLTGGNYYRIPIEVENEEGSFNNQQNHIINFFMSAVIVDPVVVNDVTSIARSGSIQDLIENPAIQIENQMYIKKSGVWIPDTIDSDVLQNSSDVDGGAGTISDALNTLNGIQLSQYTGDTTLVNNVDFNVEGDCTGGTIEFELPDALTATNPIFIKNTGLSATNVVRILATGSDDIEGVPNTRPCILSSSTEYVGFYPNGTASWQKNSQRTFTFGAIEATDSEPTIGTSFAKFDDWTNDAHSTPEKCVVNLTTNVIDILDFQGPFVDGYKVTVDLSFEYNNNNTVTAQLYVNGALTGVPISATGGGANKPVSLHIGDSIRVTSATTLELHIKAESGGASTLTLTQAKMICERIGG